MTIKGSYQSPDEIPEAVRDLYTERDGVYELTGIEGVMSGEKARALDEGLRKERAAHAEARKRLREYEQIASDPSEIRSILDKLPELEVRAKGGDLDESRLDELVGARVKPYEKRAALLERELQEREKALAEYKSKERERGILEATVGLQGVARGQVVDSALLDVEVNALRELHYDESGNIVDSEGRDPARWLAAKLERHQHWQPTSYGGGAGGTTRVGRLETNPFDPRSWNVSKQAELLSDPKTKDKALQMAAAVGVTPGQSKPRPQNPQNPASGGAGLPRVS